MPFGVVLFRNLTEEEMKVSCPVTTTTFAGEFKFMADKKSPFEKAADIETNTQIGKGPPVEKTSGSPAEPRKVRTMSPEIRAIGKIESILAEFGPEQAVRIANYVLGISIERDKARMQEMPINFWSGMSQSPTVGQRYSQSENRPGNG